MQISRLFEIVYLLLDRKCMTARALAEHFEVSSRTIYRDVDTLAQAGIPIYASKGSGGGIRLTENFVLSKAVLSEEERKRVLTALHGMNVLGADEAGPVLDKLSALFGGEREDWIEIDFSSWAPNSPVSARFQLLKKAIFARQIVAFRYSGADGGTHTRMAEPVKLVFRGYDWYLLAWCCWREDFRYFKLTRMDGLTATEAHFQRRTPPVPVAPSGGGQPAACLVEVIARIAPEMAFRVRDEVSPEQREEEPDGGFRVRFQLSEDEWMYEHFMTYGGALRVLEPERVRRELARRCRAAWEANLEDAERERIP